MFGGLWPKFDADERPITSITNGVHAPTWVAREIFDLARSHGVRPGPDPDADHPHQVFDVVDKVPGKEIWDTKRVLRQRLVDDARARMRKSWQQRGASAAELKWIDSCLDPNVLTIGFARRVPSYKRLTLMLRDPARLKRLLLDPERPVQLVIAGKSHPADEGGKKLIQEMVRFADDPEVRHRIVFLPNYDIAMAQPLYPGCDVWLNNPLRPYEACGTSGMKAALNGGLNLSILDGWWDEWYDGNNGWSIPSADGVDDPDHRDDIEAHALYDLIENEVAPRFYDEDEEGVPVRWIEMVRHTLKSLGPKVLADRMVRDYVLEASTPRRPAARARSTATTPARRSWPSGSTASAPGGARWRSTTSSPAASVTPRSSARRSRCACSSRSASLTPDDVDVQVVHGRIKHEDDLVDTTVASLGLGETYEAGRHRFEGVVELDTTGPFGYTVRVLPKNPHLASPAELGFVAPAPALTGYGRCQV